MQDEAGFPGPDRSPREASPNARRGAGAERRATENGDRPARAGTAFHHAAEVIRRSFAEFLALPSIVIAGFLALAAATYFLDRARNAREGPATGLLTSLLFGDPQAASDLLGVIATSIITVTSITFSLLLVAVQQGAAALTSQVFDQFLRRRANQLYFGFFLGLALYSLVILATISPSHNAVYGVALGLLLTGAALYMLILLIYTTIDQMRPAVVIKAIHDHTLIARKRQEGLLDETRRAARIGDVVSRVAAEDSGFLMRVDAGTIAEAAKALPDEAEIVILVSIGDYIAFGDVVAEIRGAFGADAAQELDPVIRRALPLEEQRDLDTDPAFGIEQLATIGWTSVSTAKSNPQPGLIACWNLRDILARWVGTGARTHEQDKDGAERSRIVYPDNLLDEMMKAFESLTVVASESMQHQITAEIYRALATVLPRLSPALQRRAEDLLMRSLSALGEHVPTSDLDDALSTVSDALADAGRPASAAAIRAAQQRLGTRIGLLNSRSTRAGAAL